MGEIFERYEEKRRASSRARDHVRREVVWCTALRATQVIMQVAVMKTVAAAGEEVAFSQMK